VEAGGRHRCDASAAAATDASSEQLDDILLETQRRKRGLMLRWVCGQLGGSGGDESGSRGDGRQRRQ
jgi:hypothetical protein